GAGGNLGQRRSPSKRDVWRSSELPRRGAATSALTSPRRTNPRPPSLMLWSFPVRAQPPIVDGVNRTLACSRISADSLSVIQSLAEGMAVAQSEPDEVVVVDDVLSDEPLSLAPA